MSNDLVNTPDGICSTFSCGYKKVKPKANWFNTRTEKWICMECAQEENRRSIQISRFANNPGKRPCITSQERLLQLLSSKTL